ncbi:MAG: hypothetical protein KDE25_07845 [Novosphingobium sp.]|nr:hypothetical protein [Novosphingobium sp.]
MKRKIVWALVIAVLLYAGSWGYRIYGEFARARDGDPAAWDDEVADLVRDTGSQASQPGSTLAVGSSSIRMWDNIHADLAPLRIVQRGFGGARIANVIRNANSLFAANQPMAALIFVGTNDIAGFENDKSPERLQQDFETMIRGVRAIHPRMPIYYIAITPSPLRAELWPQARQTNRLIAQSAKKWEGVHIIDTNAGLLDASGAANPEMYRFDRLHLSDAGYCHWAHVVRARLVTDLLDFDARKVAAMPSPPSCNE